MELLTQAHLNNVGIVGPNHDGRNEYYRNSSNGRKAISQYLAGHFVKKYKSNESAVCSSRQIIPFTPLFTAFESNYLFAFAFFLDFTFYINC